MLHLHLLFCFQSLTCDKFDRVDFGANHWTALTGDALKLIQIQNGKAVLTKEPTASSAQDSTGTGVGLLYTAGTLASGGSREIAVQVDATGIVDKSRGFSFGIELGEQDFGATKLSFGMTGAVGGAFATYKDANDLIQDSKVALRRASACDYYTAPLTIQFSISSAGALSVTIDGTEVYSLGTCPSCVNDSGEVRVYVAGEKLKFDDFGCASVASSRSKDNGLFLRQASCNLGGNGSSSPVGK